MRLFAGVEIDEGARRVAEATSDQLRDAIGRALTAKWVPPENMHLTVRFIGHVDEGRVPAVVDALTPPLDIAPFDVELGGCGVFPPSGPPRVLWIGLTQGLQPLSAIHDTFDRRLAPFGFEPERRPFNVHLTLARVKDASRGASREVSGALARVTPLAVTFRVTRAAIFQSHLSPRGPRYEAIAFSELRG
jgi:RNA 2',3'-cyclic 3'-phosphodiesterase